MRRYLTAVCILIACMLTGSQTQAQLPYNADSIVYQNRVDSTLLGATITWPAQGGTGTAIVLVSGTGRQDRDGTMAGHKMFALLADSLSRRGNIVLRSDDRGVGVSGGNYDSATTQDFANDALAAMAYLRSRKDLSIRKIGLLGHSEGGMAAAIAAAADAGCDFVITLSAPGERGLDALLLQNKNIVHQADIPDINKLRFDSINNRLFHLVYEHAGDTSLEQQIRAAYADWKIWDDSVVAANQLEYGGHFFFPLESYIRTAGTPWYQGFLRYDPAAVLPHIKVPYLAINGDRDILSDGAVNLAGIKKYLEQGGNTQVTTWLVPGINHLYQHCTTCTMSEYATLPETMAPEVITRIANWLAQLSH